MNNDYTFTEKEQYWIDKLIKGEEMLELCKDDKSESWLTNGYLDYLDMIIKHGNLRPITDEDEYVKLTRVIKVNRKIPKALLETGKYNFIIFNGVYIVQQVVFAKAEHCEALLNKKLNDNPNLSEHELLISSFKKMRFEDGSLWCIFLVKSDFTKQWIGYSSKLWEYIYIYDEE